MDVSDRVVCCHVFSGGERRVEAGELCGGTDVLEECW